MTHKDFEQIMEAQFGYCKLLMNAKTKEYIHDDSDRLEAFKLKWLETEVNPKEVLWGALCKHITALYDMCKQDKQYDKDNYGLWIERITDIINYLCLLRAIVNETYFQK